MVKNANTARCSAADSGALLRDYLAQGYGEALDCLRRAQEQPEKAREYTELAGKLIRTCADVIKALNEGRQEARPERIAGVARESPNPEAKPRRRRRKPRKRAS